MIEVRRKDRSSKAVKFRKICREKKINEKMVIKNRETERQENVVEEGPSYINGKAYTRL